MIRIAMLAAASLAALAASPALAQEGAPPREPEPAFAGQTDAAGPEAASEFVVEELVAGLYSPFAFDILPNGDFLVAERTGTMRIARPDGFISGTIAGVPGSKFGSASGLHDVVLDPDFAENGTIWFTYLAPPPGETPGRWPRAQIAAWNVKPLAERLADPLGTETLARGTLDVETLELSDVETVAEGADRRIAFAPDGRIFVTGAERYRFTETEWDVDGSDTPLPRDQRVLYSGRVLRVNSDGTVPDDNPFAAWIEDEGMPEPLTYSYGHRDPEGAAIHPETGELWMVEHGPMGGDELNIIRPAKDYGWPNISYGLQYTGDPVGTGESAGEGYEQPIYFWAPSIAPSGMAFYQGEMFPDWNGDLFVGALAGTHLVRLELDGERVVAEESLLTDREQRIRDMNVGPEGALYILTDGGEIWRLVAGGAE